MYASAHLIHLFFTVEEGVSHMLLLSRVEGRLGCEPTPTSHLPILYCQGGCCLHPTIKSRMVGGMQACNYFMASSTALQRSVQLACYLSEQKGRWELIQHSPYTLLYFTVGEGVACILSLIVHQRMGCKPTTTSHPPLLYCMGWCCLNDTFQSMLEDMMQVNIHHTPSPAVLCSRVLLASYSSRV